MNIFIAGAGEVGTHLAKLLSRERHDIVLMDDDPQRLEFAFESSFEIMPIVGVPTSVQALSEAGAGHADLFIAVTPEESSNVVSCMLASKLGASKTMARINNNEYLQPESKEYFKALGVEDMVYPESLAAKEIVAGLHLPWSRQYWSLFKGKLDMVAVRILSYSPLIGKKLHDLRDLGEKLFHILAITREGKTFIPTGNDTIQLDDVVFATAAPTQLDVVRRYSGQSEVLVRRVIIMGGSRIALRTVEHLPKDWRIKIIEKDYERCKRLSELVGENTLIIHGDGRDANLLYNEGIKSSQAFLALTNNSESNMIATLNAKRLGVPRSVAQIENIDYLEMATQMGIGNIINKKIIAASSIFRYLLRADVSSAKTLSIGLGDVLEIMVKPNSKVTRARVKELKIPRSITFGGLLRGNEVMMIDGNTQIQAGDSVMVFSYETPYTQIANLFE